MSVRAGQRPPNGSLRRVPRGNRAADQMALNGLLIRSDNSGPAYKRILCRIVALRRAETVMAPMEGADRPSVDPTLPYAIAVEFLAGVRLDERRDLLREAAVIFAHRSLVMALATSTRHPGAAPTILGGAFREADRRLRAVEGTEVGL